MHLLVVLNCLCSALAGLYKTRMICIILSREKRAVNNFLRNLRDQEINETKIKSIINLSSPSIWEPAISFKNPSVKMKTNLFALLCKPCHVRSISEA